VVQDVDTNVLQGLRGLVGGVDVLLGGVEFLLGAKLTASSSTAWTRQKGLTHPVLGLVCNRVSRHCHKEAGVMHRTARAAVARDSSFH